jgi:hypothetical protein
MVELSINQTFEVVPRDENRQLFHLNQQTSKKSPLQGF